MKKNSIATLAVAVFLFSGIFSCQNKPQTAGESEKAKISLEENKRIAALYHELNAEYVDSVLTDDFIGRNEKSRHTWTKENHRNYLSNGVYKKDSIFHQVAEGDWVATRFYRTTDWNERRVVFEAMHFKRFENGKIAEIWEYGDSGQVETEEE
jgi:predicted ester cyclase